MIEIPLTRGYVAIVDDIDADLLDFKWCVQEYGKHKRPYAQRGVRLNQTILKKLMHRIILERILGRPIVKGECVDHIDGLSLNNRRSNLRVASKSQNASNRGAQSNNTSGVKGVHWRPDHNKWQACITIHKKFKHLGYFVDINDAARCYNEHAKMLFGEFAWLNPIPVQTGDAS